MLFRRGIFLYDVAPVLAAGLQCAEPDMPCKPLQGPWQISVDMNDAYEHVDV